MGGAVLAVIMLGVVAFILIVNLFQSINRQRLVNADMQRIKSQEAQRKEKKDEERHLARELKIKERNERSMARANNPTLEVSDLINDLDQVRTLTGLSHENAKKEFNYKYQYKKPEKNHKEYVKNNFHVKGTVVEKCFGLTVVSLWSSDEEYEAQKNVIGEAYDSRMADAWEVIVDIGNGVFVAILCPFDETESEAALKTSAVFEGLAIGSLIEATGILSIPNDTAVFKLGVREKSKLFNKDCVHYSGIYTVRAPLSAIKIHS